MHLEKWLTVCVIIVVLLAAALFGVFDQFSGHEVSEGTDARHPVELNLESEIAVASQRPVRRETNEVPAQNAGISGPALSAGTMQHRQVLEEDASPNDAQTGELTTPSAKLLQSLHQERERSAALTVELIKLRSHLETTLALSSKSQDQEERQRKAAEGTAEALEQSLKQEQARTTALASELAATRKADETSAQEKLAAGRVIAELRQSLQQEQERSAALDKATSEATAVMASAEQQRRALEEAQARAAALAAELAATRKADETGAQEKLATAREIAELRQSLRQEQERSAVLDKATAETRTVMAGAEQQRHALEEAQARAAALAAELAATRRADETGAQERLATAREIAELRQSLQKEQERSAALDKATTEAKAVLASAEQQRRALEEAQARAAALATELAATRQANETAKQQKPAAEGAIALQQERSKTEGISRAPASAQRPIDERVTATRAIEDPIRPVTPTADQAASEMPVTANQDKAEEARLIARASALLDQGNIGAARIVLERAAENDSARARFMLAETYDPVVLSAWRTYGTRGETAKARELYAKAQSGGIREAKDRLEALGR